MEFLLDCGNLEKIQHAMDYFPITGVTSNPTILKSEGKIDFFSHMRKIREMIGSQRTLHIQVIAEDWEGMLRDAEAILKGVDDQVYVKVPATEEGFKAMRILKSKGVHVTATAIYTKMQGFLAIALDVDYIAPYYNRMENLDVNSCDTIGAFRQMIEENKTGAKILGASFKNIAQVTLALEAGAHSVTLQPDLLEAALGMAAVRTAVADFHRDWTAVQGDRSIADLL